MDCNRSEGRAIGENARMPDLCRFRSLIRPTGLPPTETIGNPQNLAMRDSLRVVKCSVCVNSPRRANNIVDIHVNAAKNPT